MDLHEVSNLLALVKEQKPLIHHITNYVTANDCANIVLALGGSPVMADEINEVEDMVSLASALVINIGTLNTNTVGAMLKAGKKANQLEIPVVLDPVGVGATPFRIKAAKEILENVKISVLRANMSEAMILAGINTEVKGVDTTDSTEGNEQIALNLSKKLHCLTAITGKKDIITDGSKVFIIENGHDMLSDVTGTGCMCTSLVATYTSISQSLESTIAGVITMGIAGEMAFNSLEKNEGIGTFKRKLFDSIYNMTPKEIEQNARLHSI